MNDDARAAFMLSSWSHARREASAALLRALDVAPDVHDARTRDTLFAYVDVLVAEGTPPETFIVALKDVLASMTTISRMEPLLREQVRAEFVSASIDRYFAARDTDDAQTELRSEDAPTRIEPQLPRIVRDLPEQPRG